MGVVAGRLVRRHWALPEEEGPAPS
jgi:hypothetical protein